MLIVDCIVDSLEWILVDTPDSSVFGDFFVVYKNWTLDLSKGTYSQNTDVRYCMAACYVYDIIIV